MDHKRILFAAILAFSGVFSDMAFAKVSRLSDAQVKQKIIEESIEEYPGTCACPFNTARNGSRCGRRSAWSRAGGYTPLCYEREVTAEMISEWRRKNNL